MQCPNCQVDLLMSSRSGIEIDYCPKCRGVWLDRGEIDKLIEREGGVQTQSAMQPGAPTASQPVPQRYDGDHHSGASNHKHKERRENPITDLFDFF